MATTPDPHPDSSPTGPSEAPDQISPVEEPGRESVEDTPPEQHKILMGNRKDIP